MTGGGGQDTATWFGSTSAVTIDLGSGTASGGDAAGDTLTSIINLIGSARSDRLLGNDSNNFLEGRDGNDTLTGRGGADTLDGGNGIDTADFSNFSQALSIVLSTGIVTVSGVSDTLISIENIIGGSSDDSIRGSSVANTITGGLGADIMTGNGAGDHFVFRTIAEIGVGLTADIITDLNRAAGDKIDLTQIVLGGGDVFDYVESGPFTAINQLRYENGVLSGETNGNGVADFEIRLQGFGATLDPDVLILVNS